MEYKQKICNELLSTLQQTRGFYDLVSLKYERESTHELVVATFNNGYQKAANVTADSGTAMIIDIIKQCQ
ncbi:hypothetical protein [Mogibacterium diversum]|uniref:hypothetical protein n=1 Tax=Mogibacterium diversum TaxID=114527 RepID=UPI0026F0EAA5|nr:hypothetical protein [Mogibacterium diversum]